MEENIKAGAAEVDITPPLGTLINGDFVSHYAKYIHTPLLAKALVFQFADVSLVICMVDICAMRRGLLDDVKKEVQKLTGIPPTNILISSTHTHAAGSVESLLLGAADLPYRHKLPDLIVQAIVKAQQNIRPAKIGFGNCTAPEYVLCRRYSMKEGYEAWNPVNGGLDKVKTNPFGAEGQIVGPVAHMDTELCFIAVKDMEDKWISILANFSMHYVGDWEAGTISSDYFGEFSKQLKHKLKAPDNFIGMLSNGTSGEANIWDFLNPDRFPKENFKKSALIGDALADKVLHAINEINWQTHSPLSAQYADVSLTVRKPDTDELEAAKKIVAQSSYESLKGIDFGAMQKLYAREQVLLHEFPDTVELPVQAFKIGDIVIGALGGEFFAETGLALKAQLAPYHYFTITLANDYVGYVCPAHEIERGGYETWRCRTSCMEVEAEEKIRLALLEIVKNL